MSEPTKKKKSRGVGQCIERGPDKHLLRVFLGRDSTGKRHYHDETFHGKKRQAQDRLRALLTKHKAGESLKIGNDTLGVFLDEWLDSLTDLKESTIEQYKLILDIYIRPKLGNLMLTKVEAADIQVLYKGMATAGLSRGTVVFAHTLLKSAFKLALRRRKIAFNPMDGVDSPAGKRLDEERKERRSAQVMTSEQVAKFFEAANKTRFGSLLTLAFHTGCRPGELLGLKWEDFDSSTRTLKICRGIKWRTEKAKGHKEGKGKDLKVWYLDTPKTAHGRRVLLLTENQVELLGVHRKRQLEERMKAGRIWENHDFIFVNEVGQPYSQAQLLYFFKKVLKAAELPKNFTPYSARHTSATLLMSRGINPKTVSERLGHSDVLITLQTYTHPTAEMQLKASEEIERALRT